MVNLFRLVAERLAEMGFFNFLLPWMITAAVFWGLLKKSKVFNEAVNGVLSLSISFFIWGFLISGIGVEMGTPLSQFFGQMSFIIIGFVFLLIGGSMFSKDFPKYMEEHMSWVFTTILVIGILVAIGSGIFPVGSIFYNFFHGLTSGPGGELTAIIVALVLFIIIIGLASTTSQGGK